MDVRKAAVIIALALPLAALARQTPPGLVDSGSIAVGIACSDGTFTPLALHGGSAWRPLVRQQENVEFFFAALTPEALRLPRQGWTLYPSSTGLPEPLTLGAPERADLMGGSACGEVQGHAAAGVPAVRRPNGSGSVTGYGILGAALFELLEDVTKQPDDDSRRMAQRVVQEVHAAERRLARHTIRGGSRSHLAQFAGRPNVRSTVQLVEMKRDRQLDGDWYFFQARKRHGEWYTLEGKRVYKPWASVLVRGWVRASDDLPTFDVVAGLEDDSEGQSTESFSIAGVLRLSDRDVWLVRVSGYERTYYRLFEIGPGAASPRRVLEVVTHGA